MKKPEFRDRVAEVRQELFAQTAGKLCDVSGLAVDVLRGATQERKREHTPAGSVNYSGAYAEGLGDCGSCSEAGRINTGGSR